MKKVTNYSMKGILKLNEGVVLEIKKGGEEVDHDYKSILESLDGEEVAFTIKHIEEID